MVVLMQQAAVDIEGPAGKEGRGGVWVCLVSTGWVLTGSQAGAGACNTLPGWAALMVSCPSSAPSSLPLLCVCACCCTGVIPFLQDLTSSLKASGIDCEVPPIVYEQVGRREQGRRWTRQGLFLLRSGGHQQHGTLHRVGVWVGELAV